MFIGNMLRDNSFMKPDNTYIPIPELIEGATYEGEGRNFNVGRWNGHEFEGQRFKFGGMIDDTELHWDADPRYGTFKPKKLISKP